MRNWEDIDKHQTVATKEELSIIDTLSFLEVQRIKKRMLEINDKIENYNKTNEMLDNLEKNVGELEKRVSY